MPGTEECGGEGAEFDVISAVMIFVSTKIKLRYGKSDNDYILRAD